ncbi:MAG TPA: ABC transporter ATP-binding protein, partial [Kiloniellales bacterium]|nr:ABC transporter ATP-binding protein [Kiloniellales bacterium]
LRLGHRILVMAGQPARLGEAIEPPGRPPRPPGDPALLALQAKLLTRLSEAKAEQTAGGATEA